MSIPRRASDLSRARTPWRGDAAAAGVHQRPTYRPAPRSSWRASWEASRKMAKGAWRASRQTAAPAASGVDPSRAKEIRLARVRRDAQLQEHGATVRPHEARRGTSDAVRRGRASMGVASSYRPSAGEAAGRGVAAGAERHGDALGRGPHADRGVASQETYRPVHAARPTQASRTGVPGSQPLGEAYRPVGTRFSPAQVTRPLPRAGVHLAARPETSRAGGPPAGGAGMGEGPAAYRAYGHGDMGSGRRAPAGHAAAPSRSGGAADSGYRPAAERSYGLGTTERWPVIGEGGMPAGRAGAPRRGPGNASSSDMGRARGPVATHMGGRDAARRPQVRGAYPSQRSGYGRQAAVPGAARPAAMRGARPKPAPLAPVAACAAAWLVMIATAVALDLCHVGPATTAQAADAHTSWFVPAGFAFLASWATCISVAAWLVWSLMDRGSARPVAPTTYLLVAAACVLDAAWRIAWCAGAALPAAVLATLLLIAVAAAFVSERMTDIWARWVPFSLWGGWTAVIAVSCLATLAFPQGAQAGPLAACAGTLFTVGALLAASYLMRRLCDDVAFGVAAVWGIVGVGVHVLPASILTGALVLAIAAAGSVAVFVPWESFRPSYGGAGAGAGSRGGAARSYTASAPAPHPTRRPATRVARSSAPDRGERRRQQPSLRTSSRF